MSKERGSENSWVRKNDLKQEVTTGRTLLAEALPAESPPAQILQGGGLKKLLQREFAEGDRG